MICKTNASSVDKQRIDEIDVAKAIGVLCVLIGHRTGGFLHNYIYLFHMPLFFILSGSMIKRETLSPTQILFREHRLLSSYYVYSFFFLIYYCLSPDFNFHTFISYIANTCTFYGIFTLWFLASLWLAKAVIRLLLNYSSGLSRTIIVTIIYISSYFVSNFLLSISYNGIILLLFKSLSWTVIRLGVILVFVYLGFVLKKYFMMVLFYYRQHMLFAILVSLFVGIFILPFARFECVDYYELKNGLFLLDILYGIMGTLLVLGISTIIARYFKAITQFFIFVGKNSIHFMASELFRLSALLTNIFHKCTGTTINEYVAFSIYMLLLSILIWKIGPLIDTLICKCTKLISKRLITNQMEKS